MSVATIADRTGYSKSSWERYLNGRLLPPRGATQALAEVTGTDVRHLGTMWELAERAWSRSEMRHDVTMEAIQVAQARAALGEFGDDKDRGRRRRKGRAGSGAGGAGAGGEGPVAPPMPSEQARGQGSGGTTAPPSTSGAASSSAAAASAASASSASHSPSQETSGPEDGTRALRRPPVAGQDKGTARLRRDGHGASGPDKGTTPLRKDVLGATGSAAGTRDRAPGQQGRSHGPPVASQQQGQQRVDLAAWGASGPGGAGTVGPGTGAPGPGVGAPGPGAGAGAGRPGAGAMGPGAGDGGGPATTVQPPVPAGSDMPGPATPAAPGGGGGGRRAVKQGAGRRRTTMFLAGLVGALVVIAAAVFFIDLGSGGDDTASASPSPTKKSQNLPSGVKCSGEECSGKDPETMGCGGQYAKTTSSAWVGPSYIEVRHSKVCKASWARITSASTKDALRITAPGGQAESDKVGTTNDAYTEMVSVKNPNDAKACATLAVGTKGCVTPGKTVQ
ncbi:DUF2690 domain-containing protein [Streptomyces iconiensis]